MTEIRRALVLAGCLCCLLAVASALPAADPRIDRPGDRGGEPIAGDWETMEGTPDFTPPAANDTDDDRDDADEPDDDTDEPDDDTLEIEGEIAPGNEVTVATGHAGWYDTKTVQVNGANVTETDELGRANVTVPYDETMTVAIPALNRSRTVDVPTVATIETFGGAAPARRLEIRATVESTPVTDATVSLDGQAVETTDEHGEAQVQLPPTAGPVDLRVERSPVTGNRTVEVAEPTVRFVTPLLFPGGPAPVQVSADGRGVSDANVSLERGGSDRTSVDGRTRIWLPVSDEATVTAEVGNETATATVGNLYLRLTAVAVFLPGFCIGGVLTYFRLVAAGERRRWNADGGVGWFLALADLVAVLGDSVAALLRGGRNSLSLSVPRFSFTWPSLPRLDLGRVERGLPSLGGSLPSFGRAFGTLPSLGSLVRSSDRERGPSFGDWFGTDDDAAEESDEPPDDEHTPDLEAEPLAPRGPRADVREAWHAFVDRLELDDRETATPGEVARRALAVGFPADRVDRLVAHVRDIEYGGHSPSPERVAAVWETVNELLETEPDEEGSS
ncbi:DUF4129 domain-containing protein [Natrinema marinum]|uniref:DUF4129 domain-containing protein n=1 Tax=Natrinema marinum TaxID=2961598 RepID=UPI0020C9241A|nr:DUF4129 domain-containing protein [Natrinema marinum]